MTYCKCKAPMVMKGSIICGNCQGIRVKIFDKRKPENTTGIINGLGKRGY